MDITMNDIQGLDIIHHDIRHLLFKNYVGYQRC